MAALAMIALCGCPRPSGNGAQAAVAAHDAAREALALIPASRCGECHGKTEQEWRGSAHARAAESPLYRAMRDKSSGGCEPCHAPLRQAAPGDPVASEGVNCDACHTNSKVDVGRRGGAGFTLHLEDSVRYGPLCDAQPHYFHTMGCSPLHESADFCAACHDLEITLPGGGSLVVFPEYREWRAENPKGDGIPCQSCHMPGERAEVAVGSPERSSVPSHSFRGRGDLFRRALSGRVAITTEAGQLRVLLTLSNTWAEHAVPTGLPERQIVVIAELLDAAGGTVAKEERSYGRALVDGAGRAVPFYAAVREVSDTRIRPGETRRESFSFDVKPQSKSLRVAVFWRPIAPALAASLSITPPPDEPLVSTSTSLPLALKRPNEALVLELRP
jgi:hypothetical protein